ncbi:hypothetical protein J3F83DRAFT_716095 [Trichoderma novae-zelandiae]
MPVEADGNAASIVVTPTARLHKCNSFVALGLGPDGLTSAQTRIQPNIGCSAQSCWNNFAAIIDDCMDTANGHGTNGGQVSDYDRRAWYWISTNTVLENGN